MYTTIEYNIIEMFNGDLIPNLIPSYAPIMQDFYYFIMILSIWLWLRITVVNISLTVVITC